MNSFSVGEMGKILQKILNNNMPVPAVLTTCCFIDFLSKKKFSKGFSNYVEKYMGRTHQQLKNNDNRKPIVGLISDYCSNHRGEKCTTSLDVLYKHARCGLVHDFFGDNGFLIRNRPNRSHAKTIIDIGTKNKNLALVINAQSFVTNFLESLNNLT